MRSLPGALLLSALLPTVLPAQQRAAAREPATACFDREAAEQARAARQRAAALLADPAMRPEEVGNVMNALANHPAMAERVRQALTESEADQRRKRFARIADDLRFEPTMEGDVPPDWPPTAPIGEVVLKHYPLYRVARADGGRRAFMTLFSHIQQNDVKMTVPVEMRKDDDSMGFLYERPDQGEAGEDGRVRVLDERPGLWISTGLRGYEGRSAVTGAEQRLRTWLAEHPQFEVAGERRTMVFNGPSVRGQRRFYEVEIPVRRKAPAVRSRQRRSI